MRYVLKPFWVALALPSRCRLPIAPSPATKPPGENPTQAPAHHPRHRPHPDAGRLRLEGRRPTKRLGPYSPSSSGTRTATVLVDAGLNPAFANGKEMEYVGLIYPVAKLIFDFPTMRPGQDVGAQLGGSGSIPRP